MTAPQVDIVCNFIKHSDCWKKISVLHSMNSIAGGVSLESINFFAGKVEPSPYMNLYEDSIQSLNEYLKKYYGWFTEIGVPYKLYIDGKLCSDGWLDEINPEYDSDGDRIVFGGRDKTCDLADSHFYVTKEVEAQAKVIAAALTTRFKLSDFLQAICDLFDIEVYVDPAVTKEANSYSENMTVDVGQEIIEIIMKECLKRGVLPVSYGDGKLTLTRGTKNRLAIGEITNDIIISGRYSQSNVDRFSHYITLGQNVYKSKKDVKSTLHPDGVYEDIAIQRYRPYVILAESKVSIKDCENRSVFEANMRGGQSRSVEYELRGWYEPGTEELWQINRLVGVRDEKLRINQTLLISEREFILDEDDGYITRVVLVHPDTYSLEDATALMKTGFDVQTPRGQLRTQS